MALSRINLVDSANVSNESGEHLIDMKDKKMLSLRRQNTSTPVTKRINTIEEEEEEQSMLYF